MVVFMGSPQPRWYRPKYIYFSSWRWLQLLHPAVWLVLSFQDRGWEIEIHGLSTGANRLITLFFEDKRYWEWICLPTTNSVLALFAPHPPALVASDSEDEHAAESVLSMMARRQSFCLVLVPSTFL